MKKLLVITNHSYMLWRFRRELLKKWKEEYEVVISTPFVGHEDDWVQSGFKMIETQLERRSINAFGELKLFQDYWHLLKKEKPDLVITYSIKPNVYAGFACRMMQIPYVVNVQGLGTSFQKKGMAEIAALMYRVALKRAKLVFFENEENAKIFCEKGIMSKERQKVLPGAGINLEYYKLQPYPENDRVHFLYLGRIMKEKGIEELFEAIKQLHREYAGQFVLDLVGFFEDEYKKQVEMLESEGIAVFHGFQQEPRPFYANADCVVMPSHHEGLSNVLLEAAATGRVIITSDIPGCREVVEHKKSGFLFPVKDARGLYEQMKYFMDMSLQERKVMGYAGRRLVEEKFAKEMVVDMTVSEIRARVGV